MSAWVISLFFLSSAATALMAELRLSSGFPGPDHSSNSGTARSSPRSPSPPRPASRRMSSGESDLTAAVSKSKAFAALIPARECRAAARTRKALSFAAISVSFGPSEASSLNMPSCCTATSRTQGFSSVTAPRTCFSASAPPILPRVRRDSERTPQKESCCAASPSAGITPELSRMPGVANVAAASARSGTVAPFFN